MAKINVAINVETVEEFQEIARKLANIGIAEVVEAEKTETPKPKKKAKKKEKVSTDSILDTAPSKAGEQAEPTKKPVNEDSVEKEVSATEGQYPDASKADVQAAMKNAIAKGKRDAIKTAFDRFNAGKISDLKEEDYSAFLTDLEVLVGE